MAYLMEEMVGKWGAVVINIGLIISLLGATLGWTLLAAEIPYVAAKDGIMPKAFSKENKNGSPKSALIVTNILTTVFLLITLVSESTYQALYSISSTAILIPYLFSALYGIKLAVKGETYDTNPEGKGKALFLSIVATVYSAWLIYAAGLTYLLMVTLLYALGIVFYIIAKKEKGDKVAFTGGEKITVIIVTAAAILAVILMAMGKISPL
jgi:arginine:ornithine antiporter/lysine permease